MKTLYAFVCTLLLAIGPAGADNLRIPAIKSPPNSPQGVLRPVRGESMEAVLARFGEPKQRLPALGEPPITRWVYERFTVYYEGSITLHAVVTQ